MSEGNLLIIDDESWLYDSLKNSDHISEVAHRGLTHSSELSQAYEMIQGGQRFQVVILDIHFRGLACRDQEGLYAIPILRKLLPEALIIVYSGDDHPQTIAKARELGASSVFAKHYYTPDEMVAKIKGILAKARTRESDILAGRELAKSVGAIFQSKAMEEAFKLAFQARRSDSNTLITGPTGVGKELVAKAIGEGQGPFHTINCAAISDTLIESEFFGYEKGAFTGAAQAKPGLFSLADGGTLFLDEVGNLSKKAQEVLLRVLQTGEFWPVGARKARTVKVRVITATNDDLRVQMEKGLFRADLFERLANIKIALLPLRERREDIAALVEHFIKTSPKPDSLMDPTCLAWLKAQDWPRNVRQLKNTVSQMIIQSSGRETDLGDIPPDFFSDSLENLVMIGNLGELKTKTPDFQLRANFGLSLEEVINLCTREYIKQTSELYEEPLSIRHLAEVLKTPYANLYRKMSKLSISRNKLWTSQT